MKLRTLLAMLVLVGTGSLAQQAYATDCSPDLTADLLAAISADDSGKVDSLISQGACANGTDSLGKSALMFAVEKQSLPMVSSLVNAGADVKAATANVSVLGLVNQIADPSQKLSMADAIFAMVDKNGRVYFLTYTRNISPIFAARCTMCHNAQMNPATNWSDYAAAFNKKELIYNRVAVKHDMPMQNMTNMTQAERVLVAKWIGSGAGK